MALFAIIDRWICQLVSQFLLVFRQEVRFEVREIHAVILGVMENDALFNTPIVNMVVTLWQILFARMLYRHKRYFIRFVKFIRPRLLRQTNLWGEGEALGIDNPPVEGYVLCFRFCYCDGKRFVLNLACYDNWLTKKLRCSYKYLR